MCATIGQTEVIEKCHLSALHLLVGFVLLDESVKECEVLVFNLQIVPWHLFVQTVRDKFNFNISTTGFH